MNSRLPGAIFKPRKGALLIKEHGINRKPLHSPDSVGRVVICRIVYVLSTIGKLRKHYSMKMTVFQDQFGFEFILRFELLLTGDRFLAA